MGKQPAFTGNHAMTSLPNLLTIKNTFLRFRFSSLRPWVALLLSVPGFKLHSSQAPGLPACVPSASPHPSWADVGGENILSPNTNHELGFP